MSEVKPFAGRNALEAAVFLVQFRNEFSSQDVETFFSLKERHAAELPSFEKVTTLTFGMIGNAAPQQQSREAGVILQSFKTNGRPDWVLRASGNQVIATCHEYTHWADVEAKARRLIYSVAQLVRPESNPVQLVMMQFVDKFVYDGVPSDYTVNDVFRPDTPYLTPFCKTTGPQWHIFQGWFAEKEAFATLGPGQVLNVLNIANSVQPDQNLATTIDHTAQFTAGDSDGILFTAADKLNTHFAFLHDQNKYILNKTLSDKQLTVIGLNK